jgi:hypothetical protein
MSLFVCDKCGCVDNTATGHYWCKDMDMFEDPTLKGLALCSECAPDKFSDGSSSELGKWHSKFEKKLWKDWRYCEVINRNKGDKK